jgi:hypothetical protein
VAWCRELVLEVAPDICRQPTRSPASLEKQSTPWRRSPEGYTASLRHLRGVRAVVLTHGAGLDGHKKRLMACRVHPVPTGQEAEGMAARRPFGTTPRALLAWAAGLTEARMPPVALASTGEYGQPVLHLREGPCPVGLVHTAHVNKVPGRHTDQAEAR